MRAKSLLTAIVFILVLTIVVITIIAAVNMPELALYVPIITIGFALALQKFVASFFAYFLIGFGHLYHVGDRIRVGSYKGDVRRLGMLHTTL